MDLTLSDPKALQATGYFQRAHTDCAGVWLTSHPACRDARSRHTIRQDQLAAGLIRVGRLAANDAELLAPHPKEQLDAWCSELTERGTAACN